MRTSCTHCGTHFKVPDKTLGKQAKCKACGKMFVITPAGEGQDVPMQEVEPKRPPASRPGKPPRPAAPPPAAPADPLGALADAAVESGSHLRPVHGVPASSRHHHDTGYDEAPGSRVRKAKGAGLSMGLGIAAGVLGFIGLVLALLTMFAVGEGLVAGLGVVALIILAVTALLAMMAVVNGATAKKHIRRARHPLAGRGNASTGVILGWLSLGLVLIAIVAGGIWLANRGGITFEKQVDAEGNLIEQGTPVDTPDKTDSSDPANTNAQAQAASQAGKDAAAGGMVLAFMCCGGVFSLAAFGFWLWMLIDCCTAQFPPGNDNKTMWVLLIVFLGALGALIYFFAGRPKKGQTRGRARYA
ncbi:MAG: PLDc N-terminal domain-containing protein [Phycisphaeraceae bacterium]